MNFEKIRETFASNDFNAHDKLMKELNLNCIDYDLGTALYEGIIQEKQIKLLRLTHNKMPMNFHHIFVPPYINTINEGIAWAFAMDKFEGLGVTY